MQQCNNAGMLMLCHPPFRTEEMQGAQEGQNKATKAKQKKRKDGGTCCSALGSSSSQKPSITLDTC
jgi:hypothetical protein